MDNELIKSIKQLREKVKELKVYCYLAVEELENKVAALHDELEKQKNKN